MALPVVRGQDPFYFAVEHEAEGKHLSVSWLTQMEPPFRHGRALRIRAGDKALHLGVCRKAKRPFVRPLDRTHEEISKWV